MRRVIRPDITPEQMRDVWELSIERAKQNPGMDAVIIFLPGEYPSPDPGTVLYKEIPTPLLVKEPGAEIRFNFRYGRLVTTWAPVSVWAA